MPSGRLASDRRDAARKYFRRSNNNSSLKTVFESTTGVSPAVHNALPFEAFFLTQGAASAGFFAVLIWMECGFRQTDLSEVGSQESDAGEPGKSPEGTAPTTELGCPLCGCSIDVFSMHVDRSTKHQNIWVSIPA
jgi:hypothetical protein